MGGADNWGEVKKLTASDAQAGDWFGNSVAIHGHFALVARRGQTVRLARSLQLPMRYFIVKQSEGPALLVADRIDDPAIVVAE